jgi:hypothetical protein
MGLGLEIERVSLRIHQRQIADERRAVTICIHIGLKPGETLGQLDQQSVLLGRLKDQKARPPIAEWNARDVDAISEQTKV